MAPAPAPAARDRARREMGCGGLSRPLPAPAAGRDAPAPDDRDGPSHDAAARAGAADWRPPLDSEAGEDCQWFGEDIADQIMFALTRPGRVQVCDMLVYPTSQASSQHIARE